MITLYFCAPVVIAYMGEFLFVIVYFGSLITGSLLTILFHKDDYNYRAVGASGGYGCFIFRYITATGYDTSFYNSDSSLPFGILYLLYSIYG
jgi:membrane associated rhomboid family serine protease